MTLIAVASPFDSPILLADILVTHADEQEEIRFPSGIYIPPHVFRKMAFMRSSFARKIFKVSPKLAVACAGHYESALQLAERLKDWFLNSTFSETFLDQLSGRENAWRF